MQKRIKRQVIKLQELDEYQNSNSSVGPELLKRFIANVGNEESSNNVTKKENNNNMMIKQGTLKESSIVQGSDERKENLFIVNNMNKEFQKISPYPTSRIQVEYKTLDEMNNLPNALKSVELMKFLVEQEYQQLDVYFKGNPHIEKYFAAMQEKIMEKFKMIRRQREENLKSETIVYERPERDFYQFRKAQAINTIKEQIMDNYQKKQGLKEIFENDGMYRDVLNETMDRISIRAQSLPYSDKKSEMEGLNERVEKPFNEVITELKHKDKETFRELHGIVKKMYLATQKIERIKSKLNKIQILYRESQYDIDTEVFYAHDYFI